MGNKSLAVYPGPTSSVHAEGLRRLTQFPNISYIVCDALPQEVNASAELWALFKEKYFFIPTSLSNKTTKQSHSSNPIQWIQDDVSSDLHWATISHVLQTSDTTHPQHFETACTIILPKDTLGLIESITKAQAGNRRIASPSKYINLLRQLIDDIDLLPNKCTLREGINSITSTTNQKPRRPHCTTKWIESLSVSITDSKNSQNVESWSNLSMKLKTHAASPESKLAIELIREGLVLPPSDKLLERIAAEVPQSTVPFEETTYYELQQSIPRFAEICYQLGKRNKDNQATTFATFIFRGLASSTLTPNNVKLAEYALDLLQSKQSLTQYYTALKLCLEITLGKDFTRSAWEELASRDHQIMILWEAFKAWRPALESKDFSTLSPQGISVFKELLNELESSSKKSENLDRLSITHALHFQSIDNAQTVFNTKNTKRHISQHGISLIAIQYQILGYKKEAKEILKHMSEGSGPVSKSQEFTIAVAECLTFPSQQSREGLRNIFGSLDLPKRSTPDNCTLFYYAWALRSVGCLEDSEHYYAKAKESDPMAIQRFPLLAGYDNKESN